MAINFPASIDGTAQTGGFTTPKFVTTIDQKPDVNAVQVAVLSTTGTLPASVTMHTVSSPFTLTYWRPKIFQILGRPDTLTGTINKVPINKHKIITRKGVLVATGQPARALVIRTEIDVPAGSETVDIANVRAALSAHFGALSNLSAGIGDTVNTGVA